MPAVRIYSSQIEGFLMTVLVILCLTACRCRGPVCRPDIRSSIGGELYVLWPTERSRKAPFGLSAL